MTAQKYTGKRLCSCGRRADICINTGRAEASHITLLCWDCAHGMIGILLDLDMMVNNGEQDADTVQDS
jgi:hypothetical protein